MYIKFLEQNSPAITNWVSIVLQSSLVFPGPSTLKHCAGVVVVLTCMWSTGQLCSVGQDRGDQDGGGARGHSKAGGQSQRSRKDSVVSAIDLSDPFTSQSTYLPVYLSTYLPTDLSTYLPTCLPICLSTYLPTYLYTYLPTYLPVYLSTYLSTYLSSYLPTCLPICLSTYLPI